MLTETLEPHHAQKLHEVERDHPTCNLRSNDASNRARFGVPGDAAISKAGRCGYCPSRNSAELE
jgi:hypothetical protein